MSLGRRQFLARLGGGLAGFGALAASPLAWGLTGAERRFLFVYCNGGWDPTFLFHPAFDSPDVASPRDSREVEIGGLRFVDAAARPEVRSFLEAHAAETLFLNGMEVRSITHDRCRRILLTGTTANEADDWGAILGSAGTPRLMPSLVASGPAFTHRLGGAVVRMGPADQLGKLLDGRALTEADLPMMPLSGAATAAVDEYLRERATQLAAGLPAGRPAELAAAQLEILERRAELERVAADVALESAVGSLVALSERAKPILTCFSRDLARCGVIEHKGLFNRGWDTHSEIEKQSEHFEDLFWNLNDLLLDLESRPGSAGGSLRDETVVVVVSEMGRHPTLNSIGGKDHWTWTSAMMIGPGVAGGRTIGSFDGALVGTPVNLSTGDAGPVTLTAAHLGATLLTLGGVDPGVWLPGVEPISAALSG